MAEAVELSVVVPVFNEEENLRALDAEILDALAAAGRRAEVIYVDDCSTDRSLEVLEELLGATRDGRFRKWVVKLRRNFGQSAALAAGFDQARGELIVSLDGDGQNNPADLRRLLAALEEGFDVVSGWRKRRKDKAVSRRFPSWAANLLISMMSGVWLHDYGCTLKVYRASLLKGVQLYGEMHRYIPIFLARIGARITEIEVDHRPRLHGESKYGSERIFKVLVDLVLIRFMTKYFTRPMHFFGQIALILLLMGMIAGFLMVVFKFGWLRLIGIDYQATFIETPLPTLAATFLIGTISSLFFGILGEILVRIHYERLDFKPYAISTILDSEASRTQRPTAEYGTRT